MYIPEGHCNFIIFRNLRGHGAVAVLAFSSAGKTCASDERTGEHDREMS